MEKTVRGSTTVTKKSFKATAWELTFFAVNRSFERNFFVAKPVESNDCMQLCLSL